MASKTGWTEEYILWDLPIWRVNPYLHTCMIIEGNRTRWVLRKDGGWFDKAADFIRSKAWKQ